TAPEVRKIFDVHGGNLGGTGCVAYLFDRRGVVNVPCQTKDEEPVMELALEQGAEDFESYEGGVAIYTSPEDLSQVAATLEANQFTFERCDVARIPQTTVDVSEVAAERVLHLLEALEDHDDIQGVATNLNFEHPTISALL
ncbi:MAG: YebC/PmpR family DNA-binding transcriptional regulator, partial [Planctomycetota bacterium]